MKTVALIPALAILISCGGSRPETIRVQAAGGTPVPARIVTVAAEDWPESYEATGTVRAQTSTVISAKVMGYVQQVNVQIGDRVTEGQVLVTIDPRDLDSGVRRAEAAGNAAQSAGPEVENAIAAAKAQLELAQSTLRRIQDLAAKKSVTAQELDEATARAKSAQANYDMAISRRVQVQSHIAQAEEEQRAARIMRDYAVVRAPFAGLVTARSVEPGTLAAPGAPLLTIEKAGAYRLEVSVEESRLGSIRTGQRARVTLDACQADAPVTEIVPSVDPGSRTYLVKLDLSCPTARTGMFGRAAFSSGSRSVIAVPATALVERGQLVSVFVEEQGVARNRLITVGRRTSDRVEVLTGLNPGEHVITAPSPGLTDGAPLEVRP